MRAKERENDSSSDALCFSALICTIDKQLAGIQIYASKNSTPVNRNLDSGCARDSRSWESVT